MSTSHRYHYDASIDLGNRNTSHTLMVELATGGKRVLDVGCATGTLGQVLRTQGAYVVGVEIDPRAAAAARRVLDHVVVGDIERPGFFGEFETGSFDCVIFGDVLEHLRDPDSVVRSARRLLAAGGWLVASIPNVAHAAVRLALLTGRFEYSETGLLDNTHVRFFTRTSVESLLAKAGYRIELMERTQAGPFDTEINLDPGAFSKDLIDLVRSADEATTYQFVVRAFPLDAPLSPDAASEDGSLALERRFAGLRLRQDEKGLTEILTRAVAELGWMLEAGQTEQPRSSVPIYHYGADAASAPDAYRNWLYRHQPQRDADQRRTKVAVEGRTDIPTISVVVPVYHPDPVLLEHCIGSVKAQTIARWELCLCDDGSNDPEVTALLRAASAADARIRVTARSENGGISAATNEAAKLATGDFVAFLDQDDELEPGALADVALALAESPDTDVLYTDEDKLDETGERCEPFFKSDWSPDQLLSHMYFGHLFVVRRALFEELGGLRPEFDGSQDYDLALRATERARRVSHVATVAYHWRKVTGSTAQDYRSKPAADLAARAALHDAMARRGLKATVESGRHESTFRVRRAILGDPLVSVIIPFHNGAELLRRCVRSLQDHAGYENWEAVLVDNRSWEPETRAVVSRLTDDPRCRVVPYPEHFNWAALNNFAVGRTNGKHLLFLNADIEANSSGWLAALVEHAERPEVGAVGARLLYPDGTVQHAGVVMGLGGGVAGHAFCYCPPERVGYFGQDRLIRNYSAVTGACMMVRRDAFEAASGFDEELTIAYNDIDFCLRLRKMGYLVVYTPFAELYHEESAARGRASREYAETAIMFRRWEQVIRGDPYFNPNLDARRHEFSLFLGLDEEDPWKTLSSAAENWLRTSGDV